MLISYQKSKTLNNEGDGARGSGEEARDPHLDRISFSRGKSQEGSVRKPKGDCRLSAIFSTSVLSVISLIFTVLYSIFHWSKSAGGRLFDPQPLLSPKLHPQPTNRQSMRNRRWVTALGT